MKRTKFRFIISGFAIFVFSTGLGCSGNAVGEVQDSQVQLQPVETSIPITMFMVGDVMTGRGIDQVMPHANDPLLHESYVKDARVYVDLAEKVNGPIQQPVDFSYIWGGALVEFERMQPDLRLINLETSIATSDDHWPGKGIHYRMHPQNIPSLTAAEIDFCSLANNHVLDWGYAGLQETVESLQGADISYAGAGQNLEEAGSPAVIEVEGKGRVIVFSFGLESSGIPSSWAASEERPGVNLLEESSDHTIQYIKTQVAAIEQPGDIVVASIHWGSNWGYAIPPEQTAFAHKLIDAAGVDVIHGHSSHHLKGIEVYKDKLILYGAGDFLNDYEGIGGHEDFRSDLTLMYFAIVDPSTGKLAALDMTPIQIYNFRANRAASADALWLRDVLNREGQKTGTQVEINPDYTLSLIWE